MNRKQAREAAVKLVYEWDMGGDAWEDTITGLLEIEPGEEELEYTLSVYNGVKEHCRLHDEKIQKYAHGWRVERMAKVDLAILRVACEELSQKIVPSGVVINEAVEISREYSIDKAGSFINGVLGSISRDGDV
ncbi:MAG: transcription antitermination factor NusB [Clostridia bacterium]|nr:transcription antitermination factor NusB [Clostridia bacterium]